MMDINYIPAKTIVTKTMEDIIHAYRRSYETTQLSLFDL